MKIIISLMMLPFFGLKGFTQNYVYTDVVQTITANKSFTGTLYTLNGYTNWGYGEGLHSGWYINHGRIDITSPIGSAGSMLYVSRPNSGSFLNSGGGAVLLGIASSLGYWGVSPAVGDAVLKAEGAAASLIIAAESGNVKFYNLPTYNGSSLATQSWVNSQNYIVPSLVTSNYIAKFTTGNTVVNSALFESGGQMGIGTTTPNGTLSIYAATNSTLSIEGSGGVSNKSIINFRPANSRSGGASSQILAIDDGAQSSNLTFSTAPTGSATSILSERMRISSSGSIVMGATVPKAFLHVQNGGTIAFSVDGNGNDALFIGANKSNSVNGNISIYSNDATAIDKGGSIVLGGKFDVGNTIVSYAKIKAGKSEITTGDYSGYLSFYTRLTGGNLLERMRIDKNGNVGIGTTNTGPYKLAVEGKIGAREIKVTLSNPWADYVFDENYELRSLYSLEQYIKANKHLPGIPSASEVKKAGGVELGDMNVKLLEKIEELTLYVIELKKENKEIKDGLQKLQQSAK